MPIKILSIFFVVFIVYRLVAIIGPNINSFTSPYYTEAYYKNLENTFNQSQYRVKNAPALIPDETVFSYASGAYVRGVDPILINSEITPLGKYIIGSFIVFMKNDKIAVIPFAILSLIILSQLGASILPNPVLALLPVVLFVSEKLFSGQLVNTPLLDIIQLPFILASLYFFMRESKGENFWFTALLLGLVASTKSVIMAGLLAVACFLFFILEKQWNKIIRLVAFLPLSAVVFILSYTKTFLDGYSVSQFIGFQKWIILYQKSKLLFPFSVWRLVFLNQWQAWWGDMRVLKAEDWQITWPVFFGLSILLIAQTFFKKRKIPGQVLLLIIWFSVYSAFLSLGVVSSRFLLPLLPVSYILGIYFLYRIL